MGNIPPLSSPQPLSSQHARDKPIFSPTSAPRERTKPIQSFHSQQKVFEVKLFPLILYSLQILFLPCHLLDPSFFNMRRRTDQPPLQQVHHVKEPNQPSQFIPNKRFSSQIISFNIVQSMDDIPPLSSSRPQQQISTSKDKFKRKSYNPRFKDHQ